MKLVLVRFAKRRLKLLVSIILLSMITTFASGKMSLSVGVKTVFWNSFEAKVNNNSIEFTWVVTEYNNKSFQIEHSLNGNDWESIALVPSKNSPESLESYSYTLTNDVEGKHYYRIKHSDIDAKKEGYSPIRIVTVKNDKENRIVSPNPATGQVRINNNAGGNNLYTKAMIFDLSGKMVVEKKIQPGVNTIAINDLTTGIYFVRVENNDGAAYTQKIIKQ